MLSQFVLLADTTTTQPVTWYSSLESMLPMLLILGVMIFFFWFSGRNQRKRAKVLADRKASLKTGDRVMMQDGMYGIVNEINADIVTIAVGPDKVKLTFNKEAISTVEYDDDKVDLSREEAKTMGGK